MPENQKDAKPNNKNSIGIKFRKIFLRIPLAEKILFTKHLSMMIQAGMPEIESLKLIQRQAKSRSFLFILNQVLKDLENGQFLSVSLSQFVHVFGDLFINIIKIGESSGTLAENLNYLSSELKKSQQLRQKIQSAIIYPVVILVATVGVTGALVFFVLPKILPIFASLNVKLPLTTRILIGFSNVLYNYWMWVLLGFIALIIIFILLLRIRIIRFAFHRFFIFLPVVGSIAKSANMANFSRTLGLLLKSGVAIVEALNIAADSLPNLIYQREIHNTAQRVKSGESINKYLSEREQFFPPTISRMIEVGETTGNLDTNLLYLAEFYENEVDEATKNLSSILEPLMLLLMGGIVGFVAISIITPIYEVTQGLKAN
ncbi:MAG: type II secretion system F family protein [Candidatus Brennerbacteria bacterium]|nr:type II secretion system F family protein [Candidatus Brennerbacteria bacterium]